jgi:hypothetical protein
MVMLITTRKWERKREGFNAAFEGTKRMGYTLHIPERIFDVTRLISPAGDWGSPTIRVRASILNILRDVPTCEHPKGQFRLIPEHNDHTPTASVERRTSTSIKALDTASIVASISTSTFATKRISIKVGTRRHLTYGLASSVEGDLVRLIIIDILDYVDLEKVELRVSEAGEWVTIKRTSPPSGHDGLAPYQYPVS